MEMMAEARIVEQLEKVGRPILWLNGRHPDAGDRRLVQHASDERGKRLTRGWKLLTTLTIPIAPVRADLDASENHFAASPLNQLVDLVDDVVGWTTERVAARERH